MASVPEPDPKPKGNKVHPALLYWVNANIHNPKPVTDLIEQRVRFGYQKYGQYLMTEDGRDGIEDLRQEIGDALMYAMKAKLNGRSLHEVKPIISALSQLVES